MTTHTDPIQLLVRELDVISATSLGRGALRRLESAGFDTQGCATLAELARTIEWDPRKDEVCHPTLTALVRLAAGDYEAFLVVVVALRRPLRDIWFSIARLGDDPDVGAELLAAVWHLLVQVRGEVDLDGLLESAFLETRRRARRDIRRSAALESIEEMDFVDRRATTAELPDDLLGYLASEGVISREEAELIRDTRVDDVVFTDFARVRDLNYKTTHQRRLRAERAIATYLHQHPELV